MIKFFLNNFILDKMILISNYRNIQEVLNLKKIVLHLSVKDIIIKNDKNIIAGYLMLSLLVNKKSLLTKSRKSVMILKIRKGMVTGIKTTLYKKDMFNFLNLFNLINIYKLNYEWSGNFMSLDIRTISIRISELYHFSKIEKFFDFFDEFSFLSISFVTNKNNKKLDSKKLFSLLSIIKK